MARCTRSFDVGRMVWLDRRVECFAKIKMTILRSGFGAMGFLANPGLKRLFFLDARAGANLLILKWAEETQSARSGRNIIAGNLTEISCLSDLQECSSRKMPMESMKSAARRLPR